MRRHDWWCEPTPGLLRWRCQGCGVEHALTAVSASDPDRLRSMLVILESRSCAGTSAGRGLGQVAP